MSESGDYSPGVWKGHDFGSARRHYDDHAGRSYADATAAKKTTTDLLPKKLKTSSKSPIVIVCDVTGSMGEWPATMFSKLPYLEIEGKQYLGDDMEICWAAIGDANSDHYPMQARPFTSGTKLKKELEGIVIEGNGGGQLSETYELGALYLSNNVEMPNAIMPIVIFIGDEMPYETIDRDQAENFAYTKIQGRLSTKEVFENLKKKFAVYAIVKPYGSGSSDENDASKRVYNAWCRLLGEDHVASLPQPQRVVDVIFGIFAKETNRIDYFREEIEGRQKPEQIETAYKALTTIHKIGSKGKSLPKLGTGKSVMHTKSMGKKTKKLTDNDDDSSDKE